mgnify:CR=1 FL=1
MRLRNVVKNIFFPLQHYPNIKNNTTTKFAARTPISSHFEVYAYGRHTTGLDPRQII